MRYHMEVHLLSGTVLVTDKFDDELAATALYKACGDSGARVRVTADNGARNYFIPANRIDYVECIVENEEQ